jgi:hypothetical protein
MQSIHAYRIVNGTIAGIVAAISRVVAITWVVVAISDVVVAISSVNAIAIVVTIACSCIAMVTSVVSTVVQGVAIINQVHITEVSVGVRVAIVVVLQAGVLASRGTLLDVSVSVGAHDE